MKQLILFSILFLGTLLSINAQIQGTVTDVDRNPVEFANVALYSLPDSILLAGTITNGEGKFTLETSLEPNSIVQVSFIGYQTRTVPAQPNQTVLLHPDTTLLGEVVVNGDLPRIRVRGDALVTSVENTVLSKAGTADDVLKRLPAISGDDGAFEVFGKGAAKIYINNREMRDPSELDRISSADIRDVEIVYNPGARYDASVKAIIRLYTIRKVGDGFGFDIRSTYLRTENTDLRQQFNLNYRVNGWDLFGTLKYERYAYLQESVIKQTTYVDTLWTQENSLRVDGISNPLTAVLGVNYEFSPQHQGGIKYTLGAYPGHNGATARTTSDVYANGDFYDRWVSKDEQHQEFRPRHRVNGYYSGTFGELTVDFNGDLLRGSQTQGSTITESSEEYDDRFIESSNRVKNQLVATRTILTHPLWGGSLSVGNEYTRTRRNEDYHTSNPVIPSSNTAIHDQNLAFFTEYSRTTPIGQFTAGIRYENVHWDYFNNGERNDEQSRKYTRWFPGFTYNHTLGNVQTQLSYSVKTIRPAYWQLGSNIFYANRFTMQKGNPFLKPSILHDVSLMSSWRFLQLAVSYKNEKDLIIHWAEQLEDNPAVTILSLINIKEMPSLSAFLTASPKMGIWSPQASIGFGTQWLAMEIRGQQVSMNRPTFMASFNNSFTLPNGFLLTVDSRFRGKGFYQNFRNTHNEFVVNAGITKTFMEDRLAVTLKGHDIFHGQKSGIHAYNDRIEINQFNQWDTQELELTVRFKFNTTHSRYKGNGAGDREIGRM